LAVVFILGTTTLVGGQRPGAPAAGGDTVVLFTQQEPSCLQPYGNSCQLYVSSVVRTMMFADVTGLNEKWESFPELAVKIPNVKDGDWKILPGNKMQVTWKIKKGYTWHDGKPVTAQDWIWAWRVNLHPEYPSADREVADRVENILAPDPYTLVVQWKKRYAYANSTVAGSGIIPKHVTERQFRANPAKFENTYGTDVPTIGNGPFVLKEWQKGSSITVEAYPNWKGTPLNPTPQTVKRITYRFISDTNTIIANVLSGGADATDETAIPFVQGLELDARLAREGRRDFVTRPEPGLVWEHIDMNVDNIHLADKRVRQALLHAVNRQELVQQLFEGKQAVSHSFLPDRHYAYKKDAKRYAFDQARARALLAEAGYLPGPDGILQKGVLRLSLTFSTTAGNRTRESVQQVLQGQWRAVGVEVRISNQPARVLFGDTLPQRKFELLMYAWVLSVFSGCEGLYTADTIPGPANNFSGQNIPGYKNDEVTKLCHAVEEELDQAKRVQMMHRVQDLWLEDLPVLPLYVRSDYVGWKANLSNVKPTGTSSAALTWNSAAWRWLR
jgi:peptide/nickel transport system substrate-binding protein